jgi:hypothetical protein
MFISFWSNYWRIIKNMWEHRNFYNQMFIEWMKLRLKNLLKMFLNVMPESLLRPLVWWLSRGSFFYHPVMTKPELIDIIVDYAFSIPVYSYFSFIAWWFFANQTKFYLFFVYQNYYQWLNQRNPHHRQFLINRTSSNYFFRIILGLRGATVFISNFFFSDRVARITHNNIVDPLWNLGISLLRELWRFRR